MGAEISRYVHFQLGKQSLDTCALLTTEAYAAVKRVRDRMPVLLLTPGEFAVWLDEAALPEPTDPQRLAALAVGPRVNSPRNEGPECLVPDTERAVG
jgi:putative SOS response-associated peptidase YedK